MRGRRGTPLAIGGGPSLRIDALCAAAASMTLPLRRRVVNVSLRIAKHRGQARRTVFPDAATSGSAAVDDWRPMLRRTSRRRFVGRLIAFWVLTRVLYAAVTYLATALPISSTAGHTDATTPLPASDRFFAAWRLWDGWYYQRIAEHGYAKPIESTFFPLYPELAHAVAIITRGNYVAALTVVGEAGSLLAYLGVMLLAAREDDVGPQALRAFASFPLAFFLTAFYADGIFIGLCAFTLLFARSHTWYAAALCAFLASLTRPLGAALVAPLVVELIHSGAIRLRTLPKAASILLKIGPRRGIRGADRVSSMSRWVASTQALLVILAVPLGYLLFSAYCKAQFGDPLAWLHAQGEFGRVTAWPWESLGLATRQALSAQMFSVLQARVLLDLVPVLLVLGLTALSAGFQPLSFTLYGCGILCASLSSPEVNVMFPDAITASGRHMLAVVPAFLMLGRLLRRWPWVDYLLVGLGFAIQAFCITYIFNGGWII